MSYRGDIRLGATIDLKFTTRRFSTGAPFTLAGTPAVACYVGNGTTEITAGITLTADFDSRTGLNHVRVVATSGNGFAAGTDVDVVITAGTVDSVSVVGESVGSFSIQNRTVDLAATGMDAIAVTDPGAPASMTTIPKMIVALWRMLFKKSTMSSTEFKLFADDGTTVNATSTVSDTGTLQTKGPFA